MDITKKERDYIVEIGKRATRFPVRISELARLMKVSEPSAFEMVERLKREGIVETRGGMVALTDYGNMIYQKIIMAHRTLEVLFSRFNIDPDAACVECSKIDYLMDHEIIMRLFKELGSPELCPHGRPVSVV